MDTSVSQNTPALMPLSASSQEGETFDQRKCQSVIVSRFYHASFDILLRNYGHKIYDCANILEFSREPDQDGFLRFIFARAWFCKVRFCPMCQWRRQKAWQGRFIKAKPAIEEAYPKHNWVLLTLTVSNCQNEALRETIDGLNKGFRKLTHRKDWPGIGWVKAIEVTREQKRFGYSHPHIHTVLLVRPSYFAGHSFISQATWQQHWKEVMKLDYEPIVDVRKVKGKDTRSAYDVAMIEVLKYAVKPDDLCASQDWLHEITPQLRRSRWVSIGGVLRQFLTEDEPEPSESSNEDLKGGYFAHYSPENKGYNLDVTGES